MDVDEIWDYFQQPTFPPTEMNLLDQRMEETTSPLPSLCPNDLETILNSFSPSEDSIMNHIDNATGLPFDSNDHGMDSGYGSFEQIKETTQVWTDQIASNDSSPNCNNFTNNSVHNTLERLLTSPANSDASNYSSPDFIDGSLSIDKLFTPYSTRSRTQSSSEPFNSFKGVYPTPKFCLRFPNHQSLTPVGRGFKPILSMCTDTSLVKEPWRPNVAKKILSAFYTPINLKSEFLATQTALDEFQSLALKEAVSAFRDIALRKPIIYNLNEDDEPCPSMFVDSCTKVRAYKRLLVDDKVTLLSNVFFDSIALESVLTYDHQSDSWNCSGVRVNRKDVFRMDASLHNRMVRIIETFPDRWRRDITVASLIYLILIFNPDLPDLKLQESIRLEQYTYIYLLQRYLEMTCKLPCEASDYHYRLMAKIGDIQNLRQQMRYFFEMFIVHYSTSSCILELIKSNVTHVEEKKSKKF